LGKEKNTKIKMETETASNSFLIFRWHSLGENREEEWATKQERDYESDMREQIGKAMSTCSAAAAGSSGGERAGTPVE